MIEVSGLSVDVPTTWFPLAPTQAQTVELARFSLLVDDLSLTMRAGRSLAKDCAVLLPDCAPYPGPLSSPLRQLTGHPFAALWPQGSDSVWVKCDDALPVTQGLSDRGISYAVLSMISDAMIAAGMAHAGQPLMGIDQPGVRAWLSEHQMMICGPGRDALVAGRICRALGIPAKVVRRSDTPQGLIEVMLDSGLQFTEPMTSIGAHQLRRKAADLKGIWWLDTTESLAAFKGYACAALEIKQQAFSQDIRPSLSRPLMVFLASSNCLGAAGLIRGLKAVFGPYVQTVLVEDVHHLHALPTLCRWPNDPEADRLVEHSDMGTKALTGVVDAVITVDDEHRQHLRARWPAAGTSATPGNEALSLVAAAAEHLRRRSDDQPHVVFWHSERPLS